MKNIGWIFVGVCALAVGFCIWAVATEGWEANRATVYWTAGIFGGVGLIWIIGNRITKQHENFNAKK